MRAIKLNSLSAISLMHMLPAAAILLFCIASTVVIVAWSPEASAPIELAAIVSP